MPQPLAVGLVILLTGTSLCASAALRRCGAGPPITRWIASLIAGVAYLAATLWLEAVTAIALSALSVVLIAMLRARRSQLLAGLRWSGRADSRAELGYPAAATAALVVGWTLHQDARVAFFAIGIMAWGDASAGLARGLLPPSPIQHLAAAAIMLTASLAVAWFFCPTPSGVAAALAATIAEATWPLTRSRVSDNWPVVGSVLAVTTVVGGTT